MLTARFNGDIVVASDMKRDWGPYYCSGCETEVILKYGVKVVPHFSHTPLSSCSFSQGESEEHRSCKSEIYTNLGDRGIECRMEVPLGPVRPDVLMALDGQRVAIEVQASSLSIPELIRRTSVYAYLKIPVLWVLPGRLQFFGDRCTVHLHEKWIHAAYFGRVYTWFSGYLMAVHFDEFTLSEQDIICARTGDIKGRSKRYSKRYRTPKVGPHVDFPSGFRAVKRPVYMNSSSPITIPESLIYMDTKGKWW